MTGTDLSLVLLLILIPVWWIAISLARISETLKKRTGVTVSVRERGPIEIRGSNNNIDVVNVHDGRAHP